MRLYVELWPLVLGTAFPIHVLDPEDRALVSPIVNPLAGGNASSGGYNAGKTIITVPHTGGSQLDGQQGDTNYTTPEHQLNPGNMYSDSEIKNVYDSIRQAPKFPSGFKEAVGGTTKNTVNNPDVLAVTIGDRPRFS